MSDKNPYSICTWSDSSQCTGCELCGQLICRSDKRFRKKFVTMHITFRIVAILGIILICVLSSLWWLLFAYLIGMAINFAILEPRLLCSHCPFYAQSGKFLHCNTLYGLPKLWKYRPGPISKAEKILQLISGGFVDLYPIAIYLFGIFFVFRTQASTAERLAVIFMAVIFALLLYIMNSEVQGEVCKKCPNFSCTMNKVPKPLRDAYIKRNSVIRDAWEKSGYVFGENCKD